MDHFWGNIFDYFKDRRVAGVFFSSLLASVGLILLGAVLYQVLGPDNLKQAMPYAAGSMMMVTLPQIARRISHARARRKDQYKIIPLSRDEINKARSKLRNTKC